MSYNSVSKGPSAHNEAQFFVIRNHTKSFFLPIPIDQVKFGNKEKWIFKHGIRVDFMKK